MSHFYKVKLQLNNSSAVVWIAVRASSVGEAIVIADNRSIDSPFRICCNSVTEITTDEYQEMIDDTRQTPYLL
ncbi:hypothetical protein OB13_10880 [Pontibacter sp. HJ8]